MAEAITLSAAGLGAVALTEGIKFLYSQAGEILKRWRERQDAAKQAANQLNPTEPVQVTLPPSVFQGQMSAPMIHFDEVQRLEKNLVTLLQNLSIYANGYESVDENNENLLKKIDELREVLEAIYQQHLTFKKEQRPSSGSPVVRGEVGNLKDIEGSAGGVVVEKLKAGTVEGKVETIENVKSGGKAGGVVAKDIG